MYALEHQVTPYRAIAMSMRFGRVVAASFGLLWCAWPHTMVAQRPAITPTELGQIADAVFSALVPPDSSLSRVPIRDRKLVFDEERTIASFEQAGSPHASFVDLHMRTAVKSGTRALLDDCSQLMAKPCSGLGWNAYAWLQPVSITDSDAVVRAHFLWADRGSAQFQEGVAPTGRALLVGFTSEARLIRTAGGEWRFSRVRSTVVGEARYYLVREYSESAGVDPERAPHSAGLVSMAEHLQRGEQTIDAHTRVY